MKRKEAVKKKLQVQAHSLKNNLCMRCGKKAPEASLCGGCKRVKYCSRDCQTAHWKEHKPICQAVKKAEELSEKELLAKKLAQAKRNIKMRQDTRGTRYKS